MPKGVFAIGDSKTAGATAGIAALVSALRTQTAQNWIEMPTRLGVSGLDTATLKARIDADIAAMTAEQKNATVAIMYNMGANDDNTTPDYETYLADTEYCLQALHTGFPNATIRMAKVWERDNEAWLTTVQHAVVDAEVAAHAWVAAGIDETVILEAGDDGATWTSDGTHPTSPDGYVREWTADDISWLAAMGYA